MSNILNKKNIAVFFGMVIAAFFLSYYFFKSIDATKYEFSFIFYELTILLLMLYGVVINNNRINIVLKWNCFAVIGVLGYSILTYGQTFIHSDIATSNALIRTQLESGSFIPDNWAYGNGEIWIIAPQTFCYPFVILMKNQSLARELGALTTLLFCCVVIYWFSKKVLKMDIWMLVIPLSTIYMYSRGTADVSLYQNAYNLTFALNLIVLGAFFVAIKDHDKTYSVIYVITALLCGLSTTRYYVEFLLPALISLVLYYVIAKDKELDTLWLVKKLLLIILPMIGGNIIRIIALKGKFIVSGEQELLFADSIEECFDNFRVAIANCFDCFGFPQSVQVASLDGMVGLCAIGICILIVFIFPIVLLLSIKSESFLVRIMTLFVCCHNLIMVAIVSLCGKNSSRYMLTSIYFSIFLSSIYIVKYLFSETKTKVLVILAMVITSCVMASGWVYRSYGWLDKLQEKKIEASTLVELGLDNYKGYATYWTSNSLEVYSDMQLKIGSVSTTENTYQPFSPFFWLDDTTQLKETKGKGSYLVLSLEETDLYGERAKELYGPVDKEIALPEYNVYVWSYDIAENNFSGACFGEKDVLKYMLINGESIGADTEVEMHMGDLLYGPYINLPAGNYEIYVNVQGGNEEQCKIKYDCGEKELCYTELHEGENVLPFSIESDIQNVEIICMCERSDYIIKSIRIKSDTN